MPLAFTSASWRRINACTSGARTLRKQSLSVDGKAVEAIRGLGPATCSHAQLHTSPHGPEHSPQSRSPHSLNYSPWSPPCCCFISPSRSTPSPQDKATQRGDLQYCTAPPTALYSDLLCTQPHEVSHTGPHTAPRRFSHPPVSYIVSSCNFSHKPHIGPQSSK